MPPAAEFLDVRVADPCSSERFAEWVCVELRAMARFRYRPDVYDFVDAMILQYAYEFINGTS